MPSQKTKPKHGGARPGAGRKPLTEKERKAARKELDACRKMVRLDPADIEQIAKIAQKNGITPHAWMVRTIQAALRMPSPQD